MGDYRGGAPVGHEVWESNLSPPWGWMGRFRHQFWGQLCGSETNRVQERGGFPFEEAELQ